MILFKIEDNRVKDHWCWKLEHLSTDLDTMEKCHPKSFLSRCQFSTSSTAPTKLLQGYSDILGWLSDRITRYQQIILERKEVEGQLGTYLATHLSVWGRFRNVLLLRVAFAKATRDKPPTYIHTTHVRSGKRECPYLRQVIIASW